VPNPGDEVGYIGDIGEVNTMLGGFLATIVTGGITIAVAAVLGLVVQQVRSLYRSQTVAKEAIHVI
jgi:hypothetical protein